MSSITWNIESMQCALTEGSYTDVVVNATWRCNGTEAAGTPAVDYYATCYGMASFSVPASGGAFTPYDQLTQQQVLGWCWANGVDQSAIEAEIQLQLDNQINPPIVQLPLPWATPAA